MVGIKFSNTSIIKIICYIHVVNKDKQQVRSWYLSLPSQINSNPDQNRNIRSKVKIFCSPITGICCGTM